MSPPRSSAFTATLAVNPSGRPNGSRPSSRSIVDIIAAVERSKSFWHPAAIASSLMLSQPPVQASLSQSNSLGLTASATSIAAPAVQQITPKPVFTTAASSRTNHVNVSAWPPLPSQKSSEASATTMSMALSDGPILPSPSASVTPTPSWTSQKELNDLIPLPAPLPPSASRQEHHRYFYALRKATRLRKKQMNQALATPPAKPAPALTAAGEPSTSQAIHSRSSSSVSETLSTSPAALKPSSSPAATSLTDLSNTSVQSLPPAKLDETAMSTYSLMLRSWQRGAALHPPRWASANMPCRILGHDRQALQDMLDDDDAKMAEQLFSDIDVALQLQHIELSC